MRPNLLILGGTTEAGTLARLVAAQGVAGTVSLAGRVSRPRAQPLPMRLGGFGGAAGLADWLRRHDITHVIDATHPFAARISQNAVTACAEAGVPLLALTRPAWQPVAGDDWRRVADLDQAAAALDRPAMRVMLAIGRMHLDRFARQPQHSYLLRLVDPPETPLPLPKATVIVDRGPFTMQSDLSLLQRHDIQLVVAKNSGGDGAYAKIAAARALGLPVLMIDRPVLPARPTVHNPAEVLHLITHAGTDLGV